MKHGKILDCTLRDGAYLVNKKFGDVVINGIISGLVKSKIDIIEIGFLQDEGYGEGKVVYQNSKNAEKYIPVDKGISQFAVLADFSRYSIDNLDNYSGKSFDIVRECFFKHERYEAIKVCKKIKEKGYKLFIQPVDILGYSDKELLEFLSMVNEVEPYCLSIVDTFGSMYHEDLHRIFELINHNLIPSCKIGFHSHNNMQLSNSLSQEFLRMTINKRKVVIDGTIYGMGRGAGNTPTELIVQYMVSQWGYNYNLDYILDLIDDFMDNILSKCSWGYNAPNFIAGCYSAHVNNVTYLTQKNSIRSKDIRYILNKIGALPRKRYDYDLLEKTYIEYLEANIDDMAVIEKLRAEFSGRNVLVLVPGMSINKEIDKIKLYIKDKNPIIVSVNFLYKDIEVDYIYLSNLKRFNYWKNDKTFPTQKKIIASNIAVKPYDNTENIVSFTRLIKCGWEHMDNSAVMLLRLLDDLAVGSISIAGFDGYGFSSTDSTCNYVIEDLELANVMENPVKLNNEIFSMLKNYKETRKSNCEVSFITQSKFSDVFFD